VKFRENVENCVGAESAQEFEEFVKIVYIFFHRFNCGILV
jgi:hypothetical protein